MAPLLSIGDAETAISRYCVGADVFEQSYCNDNGRYPREAMLVTENYGRGRTAAFASDFAPHWAGDFPRWGVWAVLGADVGVDGGRIAGTMRNGMLSSYWECLPVVR